MKKLSIPRQHFEQLIADGCIYVDKTRIIAQLVEDYKQVFFSRPRRFGKSLLLSTLAHLFKGNKELFAGLWIENNWDWEQTFPVVHFYMDKTKFKETGLETGIKNELRILAEEFGVSLTAELPGAMLEQLLIKINDSSGKEVVMLFDEYDKPINEYLDEPEMAEKHREVLSNFYGVLKPNSDRLRFLMLTGVSKFSHISIFSKLNQLEDITFNKDYLTLLGYTLPEMELYFEPYLEKAARELNLEREELLEKLKIWYNGYSWDGTTQVYNPVSIMRFLKTRQFHNFWFTTGTPEFLVKLLKKRQTVFLDDIEAGQHVFETFTLENLETTALLLQTGYLTVKESLPNSIFRLGYPNHEVRMSMLDNLMGAFGRMDAALTGPNVFKLRDAFYRNDIKTAVSIVNTLFEGIPYQLNRKPYEADFHAMLYLVFRYMAMDARAEVAGMRGRSDVVLYTPDRILLMEFKIDQSAAAAIQYIRDQGYAEPLRHERLPVFLLGINFNRKERMVDDWDIKPLDAALGK